MFYREHPGAQKQVEAAALDEEDRPAMLSGSELQESLLRWNDSNHECLLFSNENHGKGLKYAKVMYF